MPGGAAVGVMTLSPAAAQRLARFRRRTWLMVGLCLGWQVITPPPEMPSAIGAPAAHGTLELKPGSYHLMLMGLKAPLKKGTRVPATLRFAHAGAVKVEFQVEAIDFAGPHAAGGHDGH